MATKLFAALLTMGLMLPAVTAADPPPKKEPRAALKKLAEAQLAIIRRMDELREESGSTMIGPTYSVERVFLWSKRKIDLEGDLMTSRDDRITALKGHLDRMTRFEDRMRPLFRERTISEMDFLAIRFYRLQAEYWLVKAKTPSK